MHRSDGNLQPWSWYHKSSTPTMQPTPRIGSQDHFYAAIYTQQVLAVGFFYSSLSNCDMLINKKNWNFDNTIPYTQRVLSRVSRTRYVTRGLIFIEEKPEVLKQFKLQERQNSRAGKIWNFGSIFNPWRRRSINWMRVFYDGTFPVPRE
jgi:hypothetical protein